MSCERFRPLLSAWIDRQIASAERSELEEHLAECAECRTEAEGLRELHADLHRAFAPRRAAAVHVGERVAAMFPGRAAAGHRPPRGRRREWISSALSMALGFLLAVLLFQPWKSERGVPGERDRPREPSAGVPLSPAVARLVIATDPKGVELGDRVGGIWQPASEVALFVCPSEGSVRTREDARCELLTTDGCVVRMNGGAEIVFHSAGRIELKRGEIWCRSTAQAPLEVQPSLAGATAELSSAAPLSPFSCTAADATCVMSVSESGDKALVTAAAGNVSVKLHDTSVQLQPRETATIHGGQIGCERPADRLLAVSWMQPLLIRKGHEDPELAQRVEDLLGPSGRMDLAASYEAEIRSLGEYGVLPLLRSLESPRSRSDRGRQLCAMRIVSDLAPAWAIGDLIGLLSHADPGVRGLAADALQRLTQQTQGIAPETWRDDGAEWEAAVAAWQAWWARNKDRYPTLPSASLLRSS